MTVVPDVGEATPSVVTVTCGGVPSDSEWDFVEPQSFSFSKKPNFACVEEQEDMNYEVYFASLARWDTQLSCDAYFNEIISHVTQVDPVPAPGDEGVAPRPTPRPLLQLQGSNTWHSHLLPSMQHQRM